MNFFHIIAHVLEDKQSRLLLLVLTNDEVEQQNLVKINFKRPKILAIIKCYFLFDYSKMITNLIKKVTCIKSFYYIVDVKKNNYFTVTNV